MLFLDESDALSGPALLSGARLKAGPILIFDRRPRAGPVADRTAICHLTSPAGNAVTLLRA